MTTRPAAPRKPRARSQARIDAILEAARTLLAAGGVASLSIYSVAERAQIPPSSVYHFFASVPALLEALTADVHAAFRAAIQAPIEHESLKHWRDLSYIVEQRMLSIYSNDAAARQLILAYLLGSSVEWSATMLSVMQVGVGLNNLSGAEIIFA